MRAFAFTGRSGSGKTTLVERLIPILRREGLRLAAVKHAHHGFDMDQPGKDSWRMREAGARQVLVASPRRWALLTELGDPPGDGAALEILLARLDPCDLVLVEGFRSQRSLPSMHVHRDGEGREEFTAPDEGSCALACSDPVRLAPRCAPLPVFHLDDLAAIGAFVRTHAVPVPGRTS